MTKREQFKSCVDKFSTSNLLFVVNAVIVMLAWQFKQPAIGLFLLGAISTTFALTQKTMTSSLPFAFTFTLTLFNTETFGKLHLTIWVCLGFVSILAPYIIFVVKNKIALTRTLNFYGLCALALMFVVGGIFYQNNLPAWYFPVIALFGVCLPLFYIVFVNTMIGEARSTLAKSAMTAGLIVSLQMLIRTLIADDPNVILTHKMLWLGWGVTNNAAMFFMITIPFTIYLATQSKRPYQFMAAAFVQGIFLLLTFSRGCILIMGMAAPLLLAYLIYKSQNRKSVILTTAVLAVIFIITSVLMFKYVFKDYMLIWSLKLDDRGRFELYHEGLQILQSYPLLGAGMLYRFNEGLYYIHNTFLQAAVNGGIVGLIAMLFHKIVQYKPLISKDFYKDAFKTMTLAALLLSGAYGLIDVTYYTYLYIASIFCIMSVSEKSPSQTKAT